MKNTKQIAEMLMSMCLDFRMGGINEETFTSNLYYAAKSLHYDSEVDTLRHIKRVNELLLDAANELLRRAQVHDESKFSETEKPLYDELTPLLKDSTYMSDEYKGFLEKLKPALDHHYKRNSHHPEHYSDGIDGMDLFDLMEMLMDWKAASERHTDGNILKSIELNKVRFSISDQLERIMQNTANRFFKEDKDEWD